MNLKPLKGWLKHADFIILDLICLQVCFVVSHWIILGVCNPYAKYSYFFLAEVMLLGQLLTIVFTSNYKNILRRGKFDELISVINYALSILVVTVVFLFAVQKSVVVSRLQTGTTFLMFVPIDYILRLLNKKRIFNKMKATEDRKGRSLVLITSGRLVDEAMQNLTDPTAYHEHFVSGVILVDNDRESIKGEYDIPIVDLDDAARERLRSKWVDEVFIYRADDSLIDKDLMDDRNIYITVMLL